MKRQDKFSRYGRYCSAQPIVWAAIMAMAVKHFPRSMRQWASDNIMLECVRQEFGR